MLLVNEELLGQCFVVQLQPSRWQPRWLMERWSVIYTNTKVLAAKHRSPTQNIIMQNYMRRRWYVLWHLACTSHDRLKCHIADNLGKVVMPGSLVSILQNCSHCERAPLYRLRCAGPNRCRITVPKSECEYGLTLSPSGRLSALITTIWLGACLCSRAYLKLAIYWCDCDGTCLVVAGLY